MRICSLIGVAFLISSVLVGCATQQLSKEEQQAYALVVPRENHASAVTAVDKKAILTLSGSKLNIQPGMHEIEVTTCPEGTTAGCVKRHYVFNAEAGLAYIFKGPGIEVFDRFDLNGKSVGLLHFAAKGIYVTDSQWADIQSMQQKTAQDAKQALLDKRRDNLPLVRKIGARICQNIRGGFIQVGYVEGLAEEKVQIRISEAHMINNPNIRPGGFVPSIIWDRPLNWDLCE